MATHRVTITTDGREYRTTGAVSLTVTANPMRAAAQALLDQGRPPSDTLKGVFAEGQITAATLGSIVRTRSHPGVDP
jgi:hypothetical protein